MRKIQLDLVKMNISQIGIQRDKKDRIVDGRKQILCEHCWSSLGSVYQCMACNAQGSSTTIALKKVEEWRS